MTRLIATVLILVSLALGGCASSMDYTLDRKADGAVQEKEKSSCIGLFCGTTSARGQASVTVVPMAPAPNYGRYGRDHYSNGPFSYDPAIPAPHVIFGEMLNGTMREAIVNGTRRMCDTRSTAPNYCSRIMDAYSWPTLTSGWRR